jgi:ABC-type multidrug transport system ATPase subunit
MITISQLHIIFNNKTILKNLDLKVNKGEIFGIIGSNGCGKSTLLKAVATLLIPSKGKISLNGFNAVTQKATVRPLIGYLPDSGGLDNYLYVQEYLSFYRALYSNTPAKQGLSVDQLLHRLGLDTSANKLIKTISAGEKQKISIIRTIIHNPSVVLLDNPEYGMDSQGMDFLTQLLKEIAEEGAAVLIATHNVHWLNGIARNMGILNQGRIQSIIPGGMEKTNSILARIRELSFQKQQ